MRIDLHVHSSERSACAVSGEEDVVRAAVAFGLGGLVFTDHQKHMPEERAEELSKRYAPFRVFRGIECSVAEGEDIVVLGAHGPELEKKPLPYGELYRIVRDCGGFMILAHPFRYHEGVNIDIAACPPDAVELRSICISRTDEERIRRLTREAGALTVYDSDAHRAEHVGIFHNMLHETPEGEKDLSRILRAAKYECCRCEERIEKRNGQVEVEEARMRDCIARGYDGKRFREETGGNMDHYMKVKRGGSYII